MGALQDFFESLAKFDDYRSPYWVDESHDLQPIDISFDYHAALLINVRMLGSRGSGVGTRNGSVVHAIADREIRLKRCTRQQGDPLCGYRQRRAGDQRSTHEAITCPKCAEIVANQSLVRSIKHDVGAWT